MVSEIYKIQKNKLFAFYFNKKNALIMSVLVKWRSKRRGLRITGILHTSKVLFRLLHFHKEKIVLVAQSCPTFCYPMDCSLPAPLSMNSPGKHTEVGCHYLLQGIFLTQGSNPGLLHCRQILYHLSYQGSPTRCFA